MPTPPKRAQGEPMRRSATMLRSEINADTRTVPLSISSETPVLRWLYANSQWVLGYEVLDHSSLNSINLERFAEPMGGPLLFNHGVTEADSPLIGRFHVTGIDGGALRGNARFGSTGFADECFRNVQDSILVDVSIGYDYDPKNLVGEGVAPDGYPIFRVKAWELLEGSMVPVTADVAVGLGRAHEEPATQPPALGAGVTQEVRMTGTATGAEPNAPSIPTPAPAVNIQEIRSAAIQEASQVRSIAAKLRLEADFDELAGSGISMAEVKNKLLERAAAKPLGEMPPVSEQLGLTEKEKARFSVARAVLSMLSGDRNDAAFEREVSGELAKRMGRNTAGILIPTDLPLTKEAKRQIAERVSTRSALSVNTGTGLNAQPENVFQEYAGFIDLLRPASVLQSMGVGMQTGLRDNYAFVRQTAGATAYVLAEGGAPTESDTDFELVEMKPHAVKAVLRYTKQQLAQSVFGLEAELTRDLVLAHAQKMDAEGISGGALSSSLLTAAGVNVVNFEGHATWANTVALKAAVQKVNADRLGNYAYLTDPDVLAWCEANPRFTNTGIPIVENGKIGMFQAEWSNHVPTVGTPTPTHQMLYGAFAQALYGEWGALELLVNPYSEDANGFIRIVTHDFIDFQVKQPKAFAKASDVTVA